MKPRRAPWLLLLCVGVLALAPTVPALAKRPRAHVVHSPAASAPPHTAPPSNATAAKATLPPSPLPPAAPKPLEVEPKVREAATNALSDPRVGFCQDDKYVLDPGSHEWCDLAKAPTTPASDLIPCRAWKMACERPPGKITKLLRRMTHNSSDDDDDDESSSLKLPNLTWPVRVVLGALVLALIIAVVRVGRTVALPARAADEPAADPSAAEISLQEARRRLVETDVQRLLARAAAAAEGQDFESACNDTYAALLRRLEGVGLWRVEPHLTNGDMVRAVTRPRPTLAVELGAVVRDIETVQFGHEPPSRTTFEGLWARVQRLLTHELLACVLATATLLGLVGCPGGDDAEAWNASPSGHAALVPFLSTYGYEAHERVIPLRRLGTPKAKTAGGPPVVDPDVMVLLPTARVEERDWKAIETWLARAPRLLVVAGTSIEHERWNTLEGLVSSDETKGAIEVEASSGAAAPFSFHLPRKRTLHGKAGQVALSFTKNRGVYGRRLTVPVSGEAFGEPAAVNPKTELQDEEPDDEDDDDADLTPATSEILVLADETLFTNASLLLARNATAIVKLLGAKGLRVELVTDVASLVADSPAEAVERSGFAPAFLQLTVLLLFAFVARGAIFGTPRDPGEESRRIFAEHVRAVGGLYERAGHATRALQIFATFVVERLRSRHGLAGGRSLSSLAEVVAARTGQPLGQVMSLLVETKGTDIQDKEALARLRELASLLQEKGDRH